MTDKDDAHPMQLTHTIQLSLVIPVWNDPQGLERLLQQAAEFEIFHEIIVVDDASDQPVGPDVVNLAAKNLRVIWLRSEVRRGAGHARNLGLEAVTGTHVLFFDSDDSFTPEFPEILAVPSRTFALTNAVCHCSSRGLRFSN